ncbi:MAG: hypothetical protein Q8P83_00950 [bacterium]|nr:hypothetical protein [bacterium]
MAKKPKFGFVVFHRGSGRVVGHTRAVSASKAVTNVWWRRDAGSDSILASEVKDRRYEYWARPVSRPRESVIKRRIRRLPRGQMRLFRP